MNKKAIIKNTHTTRIFSLKIHILHSNRIFPWTLQLQWYMARPAIGTKFL